MKVSVIVIGYNIETYIRRCLDSVFSQDYDDYEVVFVNDGSTDRTQEIAESYLSEHSNYRMINKENGGIVSARKEGVKAANGEYVLFVDGDDYISLDALNAFVKAAESSNDRYDIILSDHFEERPNGRTIGKRSQCAYGIISGDNFLKGILDGTIFHYTVAKLFRRSFLLGHGYIHFPNVTIAEDLLTNSVLGLYQPRVLYIPDKTYYYQFNETSVTRDGKLDVVDQQLKTLRLLIKKIQLVSGDRYKDYLDYQYYLFAFGYLQTNYSNEFKKYLIKKCGKKIRGVHKNPVFRAQKMSISVLYGRVMVCVYMYLPHVAPCVNSLIRILIDLLHKTNVLRKY